MPPFDGTTTGWVNFTPSFPNLPINAAGSGGRYGQAGGTVFLKANGVVTGAATSTPIYMDLPIPASTLFGLGAFVFLQGTVVATNSGVGTVAGLISLVSATRIQFSSLATYQNPWTQTVPHTWKNGDSLTVAMTYESA